MRAGRAAGASASPSLQRRLSRMADVRPIRALKHRYCEAVDAGFDSAAIAGCFTDEGRWVWPGVADRRGRASISRLFAELEDAATMTRHHITNPVISLDGDGCGATGRFHLWCACTARRPGEADRLDALVAMGILEDRFARVEGRWLIEELRADVWHVCEWTQGWVRDPSYGAAR